MTVNKFEHVFQLIMFNFTFAFQKEGGEDRAAGAPKLMTSCSFCFIHTVNFELLTALMVISWLTRLWCPSAASHASPFLFYLPPGSEQRKTQSAACAGREGTGLFMEVF